MIPHFGRAEQFKVATLSKNQPISFETRPNKEQCNHDHHSEHDDHQHKSFDVIKDCQIVMAGGMGQRAYDSLANLGIKVLLPNELEITAVLTAYQAGTLISNIGRVHSHHN